MIKKIIMIVVVVFVVSCAVPNKQHLTEEELCFLEDICESNGSGGKYEILKSACEVVSFNRKEKRLPDDLPIRSEHERKLAKYIEIVKKRSIIISEENLFYIAAAKLIHQRTGFDI